MRWSPCRPRLADATSRVLAVVHRPGRPTNRGLGLDVAGVVARWARRHAVPAGRRGVRGPLRLRPGRIRRVRRRARAGTSSDPDGLDTRGRRDAAALGDLIQGLRTWTAGTVGPGHRVLIDGASGNVTFAVRDAKARGAEVTAVASGAEARLRPVAGRPRPRLPGGRPSADRRALRLHPRRRLPPHGADGTPGTPPGRRIHHARRPGVAHRRGAVRRAPSSGSRPASGWVCCCGGSRSTATTSRSWRASIRDGALTPAIDRRYPLEETVEALRWVDDGHAKGKVIVTT